MLLTKPFQPSPSRRPPQLRARPGQRLRNVVRCCSLPSKSLPSDKAKARIKAAPRQVITLHFAGDVNLNLGCQLPQPAEWDAVAISSAAKALLQQHGVKASTALKMHRMLGFEDVDDIKHLTPDLISQLELKPLQLEPLLSMLRERQGRQAKHLQPPGLQQPCSMRPVELDGISYIAFSSDGRRALSCSADDRRQLLVWDRTTGARVATLEGRDGSFPICAAITPDGRKAVSGNQYGTLSVWNLDTHTYIASLEGHTDEVGAVAISPDGRRAVSGSDDGTLRLWDLDTCMCIATLEEEDADYINSVAVTPDGRHAVSGDDCTLRLWDLATHACVAAMEGHAGCVYGVAITPDGRHAVSVGGDKALRIWDLETRACTATLQGHTDDVNCVAITPDGRHAVSGSDDTTLRVWDLATYACVAKMEGHTDSVWVVMVTPDGRYAVSSVMTGPGAETSRVWDLEDCLGTASAARQ